MLGKHFGRNFSLDLQVERNSCIFSPFIFNKKMILIVKSTSKSSLTNHSYGVFANDAIHSVMVVVGKGSVFERPKFHQATKEEAGDWYKNIMCKNSNNRIVSFHYNERI